MVFDEFDKKFFEVPKDDIVNATPRRSTLSCTFAEFLPGKDTAGVVFFLFLFFLRSLVLVVLLDVLAFALLLATTFSPLGTSTLVMVRHIIPIHHSKTMARTTKRTRDLLLQHQRFFFFAYLPCDSCIRQPRKCPTCYARVASSEAGHHMTVPVVEKEERRRRTSTTYV